MGTEWGIVLFLHFEEMLDGERCQASYKGLIRLSSFSRLIDCTVTNQKLVMYCNHVKTCHTLATCILIERTICVQSWTLSVSSFRATVWYIYLCICVISSLHKRIWVINSSSQNCQLLSFTILDFELLAAFHPQTPGRGKCFWGIGE